jgi:hypothetical protein
VLCYISLKGLVFLCWHALLAAFWFVLVSATFVNLFYQNYFVFMFLPIFHSLQRLVLLLQGLQSSLILQVVRLQGEHSAQG